MDIKKRIQDLLNLSESSIYKAEAEHAMMKVQELMAKYKLTLADLEPSKNTEVIEHCTGINFTRRTNFWRSTLMNKLAKQYCCVNYLSRVKGAKKSELVVMGKQEDIEILMSVFQFASSHIEDWYRKYKKDNEWKYTTAYLNAAKNTYGNGFAEGIAELLTQQMEEKQEEWGLVMVTPQEALEFKSSLLPQKSKAKVHIVNDTGIYQKGFTDGNTCNMMSKLNSGEENIKS